MGPTLQMNRACLSMAAEDVPLVAIENCVQLRAG